MTWKRSLFALITVVLFFGVIEGILWALGVSTLLDERDPFQGFSEQVRVFELDRERGVYRTRRRAVLHSFNYQEFAQAKPANGLRVFVLGGSAAAGFPWGADAAFTRALGLALEASRPDRVVEAVNVAAMSYGSHRLRILTAELLRYEPDALVVYGGHNEFVERSFYRDLLEGTGRPGRVREALHHSRLYASLARLYESRGGKASQDVPAPGEVTTSELLGLDVSREYAVDIDDGERSEVTGLFESNLRAIVDSAARAGVPVVLCTVSSNIRAWLPNQSFFGPEVGVETQRSVQEALTSATADLDRGAAAEAVTSLEAARGLAPRFAETHFHLGRAYAALGRWDEASEAFLRARDTDGKPSRAPGAINDAIRRVTRETGAQLVDIELRFEQLAVHGIPGFDLFEDYVHLKPRSQRELALALWQTFQTAGLAGAEGPADPEFFARVVGHSDEGPVTDLPEAAVSARTPQMLFNLAVVLENQGLDDEALEKYRACLELDPRYYAARYNVARLLARSGNFEEALAEHRRVLELEPEFDRAWVGAGESLRAMARTGEAERALRRATEVNPRSPHAWSGLGAVLVDQNRQTEAEQAFRESIRLDPRNVENQVNLGLSLLFQHRLDEAEQAFRDSLDLRPHHRPATNGLAAVLTERGRFDEAEQIFRDSLRLDPEDAFARGGLALIEERRADSR